MGMGATKDLRYIANVCKWNDITVDDLSEVDKRLLDSYLRTIARRPSHQQVRHTALYLRRWLQDHEGTAIAKLISRNYAPLVGRGTP